jgi:hypothetical protein
MNSGPESLSPFLDELAAHTGASIAVERSFLRDIHPAADFVLLSASIAPSLALAECALQRRAELASKLVPLRISNTDIFETLEELSLPAAITSLALVEWRASRHDGLPASGLHGQREIGQAAGASCVKLFQSQRYCYLESKIHHGLPHLLADYLRAWARFRHGPA